MASLLIFSQKYLNMLVDAVAQVFCMFIDRKPRELLKQYSRISIVDGTSLQANTNRFQSFGDPANNTLRRGLSIKSLKSHIGLQDEVEKGKGP